MPGTFILKPIEANIHNDADIKVNKNMMDSYCKVKIGDQKFQTHSSRNHGVHPVWNEELVVQQGDKSCGKVVIKDSNNHKKIGKVRFNLDEVRSKGKVSGWFDIYKHNKVQGQLLMDMIYTSGNPQSASFHNGAKVGAAIPTGTNLSDLERFQRHSESESKKFMLANGMSNPNIVMLGVNENIGHTGHNDFHHHNLINNERLGPNGEIDLRYTNDATLRDLKLSGKSADTGMSNPNTAKLGINHKEGPFGVKNPYNENYVVQKQAGPKQNAPKIVPRSPKNVNPLSDVNLNENHHSDFHASNPNMLGLGDERFKGIRKVSFNGVPSERSQMDSFKGTHENTRRPHRKSEDLGLNGTEMSNPNNAKFHVNQNIGHTGKTNFHENIAMKEHLGPTGMINEMEHLNLRDSERSSYSGMSNPNNAGLRRFY